MNLPIIKYCTNCCLLQHRYLATNTVYQTEIVELHTNPDNNDCWEEFVEFVETTYSEDPSRYECGKCESRTLYDIAISYDALEFLKEHSKNSYGLVLSESAEAIQNLIQQNETLELDVLKQMILKQELITGGSK
jgi:hypothetical protein